MSINTKIAHADALLQLWENGIRDAAEIQRITTIPRSTIFYNLAKLRETGTTAHKKRSGRPKKINKGVSNSLGQYVRKNPALSSRKLAGIMLSKGISMSYNTILRYLAGRGFRKGLPIATPMLTRAQREKRVEWAKKHINDNWKRTLFSDETSVWLFSNTVQVWFKDKRPFRRIPKDRTRINAWGGFCAAGKTNLYCFKEIMTGEVYVDIIEKHIPQIEEMLGNRWRLQQDNDPKHTSRVAKGFLQENVPTVMDWPSNSPDLNPIENLWAIVKRNVEIRRPGGIGQLERYMKEEWAKISEDAIKNLVGSMKRRCELVIEAEGDRISY